MSYFSRQVLSYVAGIIWLPLIFLILNYVPTYYILIPFLPLASLLLWANLSPKEQTKLSKWGIK